MLGAVQGKLWGTTQRIFENDGVQVERISVVKGGYCSKHTHAIKHNLFYVDSGKLKVTIFRDGAQDETILGAGMSTVVAPGELHQFEALEPTLALEVYYVRLSPDDIRRESQGGVK